MKPDRFTLKVVLISPLLFLGHAAGFIFQCLNVGWFCGVSSVKDLAREAARRRGSEEVYRGREDRT